MVVSGRISVGKACSRPFNLPQSATSDELCKTCRKSLALTKFGGDNSNAAVPGLGTSVGASGRSIFSIPFKELVFAGSSETKTSTLEGVASATSHDLIRLYSISVYIR